MYVYVWTWYAVEDVSWVWDHESYAIFCVFLFLSHFCLYFFKGRDKTHFDINIHKYSWRCSGREKLRFLTGSHELHMIHEVHFFIVYLRQNIFHSDSENGTLCRPVDISDREWFWRVHMRSLIYTKHSPRRNMKVLHFRFIIKYRFYGLGLMYRERKTDDHKARVSKFWWKRLKFV